MSENKKSPNLNGDPDFKKYFNAKDYNTIMVGEKRGKEDVDIVSLLTDPIYKHLRHDVLTILKNNKGGDVLLNAVATSKNSENKQVLLSACWESGIDFSGNLTFFNEIALNDNLLNSFEAITVIENLDPLPDKNSIVGALMALDKVIQSQDQLEKDELLKGLKVIYNDMLIKLNVE